MHTSASDSLPWSVIAPYLDRALELEENERDIWMAELKQSLPTVAACLRALLMERDALNARGFLCDSLLREIDGASSVPAHPALTGLRLGSYTLDRLLGRGGMGEVWLARRSDGRFEGVCAFKFLQGSLASRNRVERFRREGQALARLTHPNIARLLDAGATDEGVPYLALEYVDGVGIDRYCNAHGLIVQDRVRLFLDVIGAVAHAHGQLVLHRDLKPSNVFVTSGGEVKLLDFGIAKLLNPDHAGTDPGLTLIEDVALTPDYAAPEQSRRDMPTTATDVYQLGMLFFVLLTGRNPRHPAGPCANKPPMTIDGEIPPASQLAAKSTARMLRGDLDAILAKALRQAPDERYATAQAMREDVLRYLNREPVHARRDVKLYRARRFIARHRFAVAASLAIVLSLAAGIVVANRERTIAQQRFEQVRALSNRLFDIDAAVRDLPGNVAARQLIVDTSLEYLERLAAGARDDPGLALDLGTAYLRVARVQGIPIASNLGQLDQADRTLEKATALIDSVLAAQPDHRTAFARKAQIAHDRMIIAGMRRPDTAALTFAEESSRWLEKYLRSGPVEPMEAQQLAVTFINVGNRYRIVERFGDALRQTLQAQSIAAAAGLDEQVGGSWIGLGRIHRDSGELESAVAAHHEAATTLERVNRAKGTPVNERRYALALIDHAETLGLEGGLSLGRTEEAIELLRRGFAIADGLAHRDAADADSRSLAFAAGKPLADLLRHQNPAEALALHDHLLQHLAEVQGNVKFRRDEVRVLAASAILLQRQGRNQAAQHRLDGAFQRLRELKLYPSERIAITAAEPIAALMALAEFQVGAGEEQRGLNTCEELLTAIAASQPQPLTSLWDAVDMAHLWHSVAALQRRAGAPDRAAALDVQRLHLWQHWDRARPEHSFIRMKLAEFIQ